MNALTTKKGPYSFLKMQPKSEKSQYGKGYNAALRKCNLRAQMIAKRMVQAYLDAIEQDEDCDDDDDDD